MTRQLHRAVLSHGSQCGHQAPMLHLYQSSPDHLNAESEAIQNAESGNAEIYGIFRLGEEKALLSNMKHSLKERIKAKDDSLFYINGRKDELTCQECWAEAASLWNPIPRPEGKGVCKVWGGCFLVWLSLNKVCDRYWLLYHRQKKQKNIFSPFTFRVPERYALTAPQKCQHLSIA